MKKLFVIIIGSVLISSYANGYEGKRSNSILLNGVWEFAQGEGNEKVEIPEGQTSLAWQKVKLPGRFPNYDQNKAKTIKFIWVRRQFEVTRGQTKSLAILRWNYIAFGASAFINGQKVGENEPTGPYQVIIPEGVLKQGKNEIVLKVPGEVGVRKAESGFFLIPAGFPSRNRSGMPAILDDVWIDFSDRVYMKWALAIPNLEKSMVRLRITLTGVEPVSDLKLIAEVRSWKDGMVIGKGDSDAAFIPDPDPLGGKHFFIDVPMPGFKPWNYEECNLYTAGVKVTRDGVILDSLNLRFGMREISVANGNYMLNGKTLRLRGSNLVFEWEWGNTITGKEKDYLVNEAREMNLNSFRTHSKPLPELWANICDEYGTMILAEFPVLYNYHNYQFTPQEYTIWHKNVLSDAAGWMARLWNHPSVIMWVLSNESTRDNEWEEGPYQNLVNILDPTRPTMRTGTTGTKENLDFHACGNIRETAEGGTIMKIPEWISQAEGKTLTNSEYMNTYGSMSEQWTGIIDEKSLAFSLAYAQLGMEHTEAMRRSRLDLILPYMYAGWTKTRTGEEWKAGFAKPVSACWHSSMSPVLASLDLFNPDYLTSQEVTTELYLINDSWHDATIHVDLMLTRDSPEFIPEAPCFNSPIAKWSYDFKLQADSITRTPVRWEMPVEEGNYWLTARTTGITGRPVISQRFVRAIKPPVVTDIIKKKNFIILGADPEVFEYFRSKELKATNSIISAKPDKDIVIIWNPARLTVAERQNAKALCDFASAGGRIVILSARTWDWKELCDVSLGTSGPFSRVFAYRGIVHPMLSGIDPEWLIRWNGLPGTVAVSEIKIPELKNADADKLSSGMSGLPAKKILWAGNPASAVVAEVPATVGRGTILFSQLDIQSHIDHLKPDYDPVAEKILFNLLGF